MRDGSPFAMAGLWERWKKGAEPIENFTIITGPPNSLAAELHDRMPRFTQAKRRRRNFERDKGESDRQHPKSE